jgi:hypothetical protein
MGDRANLDKQHFYEHPNSCGLLEIFRNDILVVRVAVTPDVDKAKTHSEFMQGYEFDFCCQNLRGRLLESCDGDLLY